MRGAFVVFFCINEKLKMHVTCKSKNKMQDAHEKRSWQGEEEHKKAAGLAAHFLPLGLPFAYWHHFDSVQVSQAGFLAAHTRRPWKIIQ